LAGKAGGMKKFGSFKLDTLNQCLWRADEQIALSPRPFSVLRYLVENPGRLVTHNELLDALWPETYVQPQVLRTYMLDLRKILGDDAARPRFIQTLPKRGYCFVALVTDSAETDHDSAIPLRSQASAPLDLDAPDPAGYGVLGREIVGRDSELAQLKVQMRLATRGQRQIIFITGESGIGKTSLIDAFCRQLGRLPDHSQQASVARGQCVEGFAAKEEYYPVMEALGALCASPDGERACHVFSRIAPTWLAALGREVGSATPSNGQERLGQERLLGDLCGALEELSAEKPLILIFEDLQLADDSTLHLISALARRRAPARLIVLATYRPRHGTHDGAAEYLLKALKQDLRLRRLCTETTLAPLTKSAVIELLHRELQQETLPPSLASFVHQRSEGNPLFAVVILEHLIAQCYLVRERTGGVAHWDMRRPFQEMLQEMEASVPDGLAQMIELEIERLSEREQSLLEAASLVSVASPAWAVAAALEQDLAETEEACDALTRRLYFVQRAGQDELPDGSRSAFYVFAHELYREVLYQRQTASRRARRHIRIAERLGQLFAEREASVAREMASHFEAAGDWPRAVQALRGAADHARQRRALAEAAELLENALRIAAHLPGIEREAIVRKLHSELNLPSESTSDDIGLQQNDPAKV
jgi:DNA-binding winged helix-turn-helix (wHTH) protein